MKSIIFSIIIALVPSAVIGAELNSNEKEMISAAIRDKLTDPESARFKWVPHIDERKEKISISVSSSVYCGIVNSKNRLGGYAGDTPYAVFLAWSGGTLKAVGVLGIGDVLHTCNEAGY